MRIGFDIQAQKLIIPSTKRDYSWSLLLTVNAIVN